jgi:hypothetical protein
MRSFSFVVGYALITPRMSHVGTKRTSSEVRNSDAIGGKPDTSLNADFGREW